MSEPSERERVLEKRLKGMEEVGTALSASLDLDDLLPVLMEKITSVMGCDRSTLFLVDPERRDLWSRIVQGEDHLTIRLPRGEGIAGKVARSGESLNTPDAHEDPSFVPEVDRVTGYRTRTMLSVPLRNNRGETTGVVQALNRMDGKPFDEKDLSLLEALASQVSAAIEISKLYGAVVKHNLELDALFEIEREISLAQDPAQVVNRALAKAMAVLGAEAGSILLVSDDDRGKLYFRTALGGKGSRLKGYTVELGRGIVGWVAKHGKTARVNNVRDDERFDPLLADMIGFPARQIMAAPLESEGSLIGAVELVNCIGGGSFTEENERLLRLISIQIARVVRDAREIFRKRQRERLAEIGRMLSGLVHDLNTPITVVSACSEFLAEEQDRDKRRQLAERIHRQLETLNKMTRDIMAFAKGKSSVLIRKVYLHTFCDELQELVDAEVKGSGVEVVWDRSYMGAAHFDHHCMRRALLNLARNAIQAMHGGGRLEVSIRAEENELVFRIADNGAGIPEEIRDTLFDTFVTCGKADGTGLGLAIVKQAIEDHRGSIDVETAAGQGTTFTVRLPLNGSSCV
jgi:signal transduction histidine kinase